MAKRTTVKKEPSTEIRIGDMSNISGSVNIAGGDLLIQNTSSGLSAAEIKQLFAQINNAIDTRPSTDPLEKEDLKAEVQEIQQTVSQAAEKNEPIDESFLARRFRNIARIAPDILDVVVAALGNPLAGLGVAVKKIAERANAGGQQPG